LRSSSGAALTAPDLLASASHSFSLSSRPPDFNAGSPGVGFMLSRNFKKLLNFYLKSSRIKPKPRKLFVKATAIAA
jgi:hypothetical protein